MSIWLVVAVYGVVFSVAIALATGVLGVSLFIVEPEGKSSFSVDGVLLTWVKCFGIALATTLLSLLPFGSLLSLVLFFLSVMFLFQMTFGQTFVLLLVNGFTLYAVNWATWKVIVWVIMLLRG